MGRCIVFPGIRLLLHIRPFIFLYFLSNFQTLKSFITLFSGPVRPRRLKLGTHMDNGWMHRVYRNHAAALIRPFIYFHFSLQFSSIKSFFITLFSGTVRPRRLKHGTHVDSGQMHRLYKNQAAAAYSSLYFVIFLSLQFSSIKNFRHTFLRKVRPRRLKLGTHVNRYTCGQWADVSCIPESCCCSYSSLYFFIFLSLQFSSIKNNFVTHFSGTVRPRRLKLGTHMDSGQMYRVYRNQVAAAYSSLYCISFLSLHSLFTCVTSFNLLGLTVPEKSATKMFNT